MLRLGGHILTSLLWLLASLAIAASEYVAPEAVPGATTVDTAKAKALFDTGVVFIDVPSDADWEAGRIPGAIHLELKQVYGVASLRFKAPSRLCWQIVLSRSTTV